MKSLSVATVISFLLLTFCSKTTESLNSAEVEIISSESLAEACVAEASEMSIVIFNGLTDSQFGSTLAAESIPNFSAVDSLLTGAAISVSGTGGANNPQGTITIDFKDGTSDKNGNLRMGKIIINYFGRRWAVGSSYSISFSKYSRNKVMIADAINYNVAVKDSTADTRELHHLLKDCILTFPDQTTFKRKAEFTTSINFISKTTTLLAGDTINNGGTTRYGVNFFMNIKTPVIYKPQCIGAKMYLPNEGTKNIFVQSSIYTVDYRTTVNCSRAVNVTSGEKAGMIIINSDGN